MLAQDEEAPGVAELDWWQSLLQADSNVFSVVVTVSAVAVVVLLAGALLTVRRAGQYQPPVVTVSIILGVATLSTIVALVLRPELTELVAVVGSAVGGLTAAITLAFERRPRGYGDEAPADEGVQDEGGDGVVS